MGLSLYLCGILNCDKNLHKLLHGQKKDGSTKGKAAGTKDHSRSTQIHLGDDSVIHKLRSRWF